MIVIYMIILLALAFSLGFISHGFIVARRKKYGGIIIVKKDEENERTIYSLELEGSVEELDQKKEILFKVDISEQSS